MVVHFLKDEFLKLEFVIPYIYMVFFSDQASGQVGNEDGGGWEEVGNGEKDEEQQEDEAAQELFSNGSEAFENGDFISAVDCLRRSLKIRLGFFLSTCRSYPKA
jgi:hypothetical protein